VLCEKLGYPSPRYLLERLTSAELEEWRAFWKLKDEQEAQQMAAARAEQNVNRMRGR